jgi:hypothetical protein
MPVRRSVPKSAAVMVSLAAATTLAGCQSAAGPHSGQSPSTPAAKTSTSSSRAGKPSIHSLQSALEQYFANQHGLSHSKANAAAECAVYPTFQELSRKALKRIVHHDATAMNTKNTHSFRAVVKECITAAK